jgi:MFS superfamily sulfate permease-like transporter
VHSLPREKDQVIMTDIPAEVPEGTPLTDIPAPALGTTAIATGLVSLFAGGYLIGNSAAGPAWVIGGAAGTVFVLATTIAALKGASS